MTTTYARPPVETALVAAGWGMIRPGDTWQGPSYENGLCRVELGPIGTAKLTIRQRDDRSTCVRFDYECPDAVVIAAALAAVDANEEVTSP